MINEDAMMTLKEAHCALHALVARSDSLMKHTATLQERIKSDTEILDWTHHQFEVVQIGMYWAKKQLLEELKQFLHENTTGLHYEVHECLVELCAAVGGPVTGTQLRERVEHRYRQMGMNEVLERKAGKDLTILEAIHELTETGLIVRGGPDDSPQERGMYWPAITDLKIDIEKHREIVSGMGDFMLSRAVKPNLPNNVTVLRPK